MNYQVTHTTEYIYGGPVSLCHNVARLFPCTSGGQVCHNTRVQIFPEPDARQEYPDFFGNKALYFAIQQEHKRLVVTVVSEVSVQDSTLQFDLHNNISWEEAVQLLQSTRPAFLEARQFVSLTSMTAVTPEIKDWAQQSFTPGRPLVQAARDLMHRIFTGFIFKPGFTTVTTSVPEVFAQRKGVCQDFAHLAIACLRSLGLAARYVSGYIETNPPPGKEKLAGTDASHAWVSVFIPNEGWLDFDPTNDLIPAGRHITIGYGRDYADVPPLKGVVLSTGRHHLQVRVDVKRI